jgi:hypothetical protein
MFENANPLRSTDGGSSATNLPAVTMQSPSNGSMDLFSFLSMLSNEENFDDGEDSMKHVANASLQNMEQSNRWKNIAPSISHQFFMQCLDFDVTMSLRDSDESLLSSRKNIFRNLQPSVTELDSFGAWRSLYEEFDDEETMVANFQKSLLLLEEEFLSGSRLDYSVVDSAYLSDDISSNRWKSVTTIVPSFHVCRSPKMEICCILSFTSKSFLQRLDSLQVANIVRIVDESLEQNSSRFLSASGAMSSRRKGNTFIVNGEMGLKSVNLALLELLYELIVEGKQLSRPLPVLLSSTYFPFAQRVPTQFTWLQNAFKSNSESDSSLIEVKSTFRISGILHSSSVARCVEAIVLLLKKMSTDSKKRKTSQSKDSATLLSTGLFSLEKAPGFSSSSISSALLSSFRETMAPVKPFTKLALLNQRSQTSLLDANLKDPFMTITAKDASATNSPASSSLEQPSTGKKRFALKRNLEVSHSRKMENNQLLCNLSVKANYFRLLPHFSIVSIIMSDGILDYHSKLTIAEIVQLQWRNEESTMQDKGWFEGKSIENEMFRVNKKERFCIRFQSVDYSLLRSRNSMQTDDNWLEDELHENGSLQPLKNYNNPYVENTVF